MSDRLTVATFNFEDGGWDRDHDDYRRLGLLGEVVAQVPQVDVLCVQEARGWDADGGRLLLEVEQMLARVGPLRGFLTPQAGGGPLHQVVFVRWPRLRPIRHYSPHSPGVVADQVGFVHVAVDGLDRPLKIKSIHLPYWSGQARLDAALRLPRHANPSSAAILAGDFQVPWTGQGEFQPDFTSWPPHLAVHKTLPPDTHLDGRLVVDRRAMSVLAHAGYVNAGSLAEDLTTTGSMRVDHILVSPWLAPALVPASYRVWVNDLAERASDHRMVSVALDLSRLAGPLEQREQGERPVTA